MAWPNVEEGTDDCPNADGWETPVVAVCPKAGTAGAVNRFVGLPSTGA